MILPRAFFDRPAPVVARELIGKTLVRRLPDGTRIEDSITETEAYDGFEDSASHAHRGKTARNAAMFGPPGHTYIYLCYGIHWLLNLTAQRTGYPAAVLIRGTAKASGPGRLTRYFRLTGAHNSLPLRPAAGIWLASKQAEAIPEDIRATPRIGINYADPEWRSKPWRFVGKTGHVINRDNTITPGR